MNKKIKRALFEISKNSRITTKNLSKQIKTSQQSASYLMKQLKKKKLLTGFTTIADPAKLGYTNVVVGFNFRDFNTCNWCENSQFFKLLKLLSGNVD